MKKRILTLLCILVLLLSGGCEKEENKDIVENKQVITFENRVKTSDIWILPQTEKILKTSAWGKATIPGMEKGGSVELSLDELGGPGVYVIRIIDDDHACFAMNDVPLNENCSIIFLTEGNHLDARIEIRNETGELLKEGPVFEGMLGGR